MLRPFRIFTMLLLVLSASVADAAEYGVPTEIIENGGFEQGLEGWKLPPGQELIADAKAAHHGEHCVMGEVTAPNQALKLIQDVPLRKGNLYRFTCWARGTNHTKLVIFGTFPGEEKRRMIAVFQDVPGRWRRFETLFDSPATGDLQLEVIAPSSFGSPLGKMWIDDVSVMETAMPPIVELCPEDEGYQDEPRAAVLNGGRIGMTWRSFQDELDRQWATATASDGAISIDERMSDGVHPEIFNAIFSAPPAPGVRGQIVAGRPYAWGQAGVGASISPLEYSCYDPSGVVLEDGTICVAYHSFRENNYDIYMRTLPAGEKGTTADDWTPERRLTTAPTIDRHAELIAHGKDLYLVYENANTREYHIGSTVNRHLVFARIDEDGLKTLPGGPLSGQCENPCLAVDDHDRLWIAYRKIRGRHQAWGSWLTAVDLKTGRWLRPMPCTTRKGPDRAPALAIACDTAYVISVCDEFPRRYQDREEAMESPKSRLYVATVELPPIDDSREQTAEWVALEENPAPWAPAEIRLARGEDLPQQSTEYDGQTLNLYFGDLHEHSEISICNQEGDGSLDESYQAMRDIARYDFACITDHGYNMNPYRWHDSAMRAKANDIPGRFLTFLGFEWTSTFENDSDEHPYGYFGHRNLILADLDFPRWWNAWNGETPADLWMALREMNANFVHIPHQLADTGNVPCDYSFHDETAQPVAEIFQTRGSYEYLGAPRMAPRTTEEPGHFYQDMLASGMVIGAIAAPDHGGGYGKAAVWAPELSREAILDAIRARRCYGTTCAKIALDVRVNGHMMGERVAAAPEGSVEVKIRVLAPQEIKEVAVCRNNEFIDTADPEGNEAEITFVDTEPLSGASYYYVRVILDDGEIAWTSPVWLGKP